MIKSSYGGENSDKKGNAVRRTFSVNANLGSNNANINVNVTGCFL